MNKTFKKSLVALVSGLMLTACGANSGSGNSSEQTKSSDNQSNKPVEITFWHAMNGPHQEALTELTKEFNESQNKYHVTEQNQGSYADLTKKVMAAGVSKDLPTMSQATQSNIPDWTKNQLLAPLDDILKGDDGFTQEELDDIYPGFMQSVEYKGKTMAMPFSKSVRVMFVNDDILKEYGVDVPKTWDDVKALGEKMKAKGDKRYAMGLEKTIDMELETMARQNGADWIKKDLSNVDFASDKALEPLKFIKDGIDAGWARTAGEDGYMSGPFGRGEVALYIGSSAGLAHITPTAKENNVNWSAQELPVYNKGEKMTLLAGNDLAVFKSASDEQKKGAVAFMHFLLKPENTAKWATKTGYVPVNRKGVAEKSYQDYLKETPQAEAATKENEYATSQAQFVGSGEYRDNWSKIQDKMLVENQDLKQTMEQFQTDTKKIIEDNNK
ncbi:MAG: ABC transporter substrate-binding protein [Aerococcus sp.]|nr:ABC transporter substrate-binding protein [Aerococcus sp.]